ncbi:MAG: hypothetical protein LBL74_04375 [Bacteroidales bacterium]|jgi:hypothetical protein|nr:hypothetical protein [Bacteroidales bacterium]
MKVKHVIFSIVAVVLFSSCATMFNGPTEKVLFNAAIPKDKPATLIVDDMVYYNITFPCIVSVDRGFASSVATLKVDGYKSSSVLIKKTFNYTSLLNILTGGGFLVGFGVDAASGSMMKLKHTSYDFYVEKE